DFTSDAIVGKGKALTTKWDYTAGIDQALSALDSSALHDIALVSVSTTLATNAIVEGRGQVVGLLVMPPYGIFHPADIPHQPKAVIAGRLEIDGREISPIDADEIRRVAREMVERGVGAFAVSGYASVVNPAHELSVKAILKEETGLSVTCGHELSELLNFITRADTAVLNARIMPRLEKFLREVEVSLRRRGIRAPIMVVKGDGSLMNTSTAAERPIETVLSGPAASVAGAIRLTNCSDALVVDVGGTTSDTAAIRNGAVRTCDSGARVGRWQTHVRALDMRTVGLGGDSLIAYEKRTLHVGPVRVAPVAWLASERPGSSQALDFIELHADDYLGCTRPVEIVTLTGHTDSVHLDAEEAAIVKVLAERPCSLAELAQKTGAQHWGFLRLGRLEEHYVVQRCCLTPTDLLHTLKLFERWDTPAAERLCGLFSHICGYRKSDFVERVMDQVVHQLAIELLKKQLDDETAPDRLNDCPVCKTLLGNMLRNEPGRGDHSAGYEVAVRLHSPVIGLGAPVQYFLPRAARLLGTEAIIPEHADVANAVGAITSRVMVRKQVQIRPNDSGQYAVHGLPDARCFDTFDGAHHYAVAEIERVVLQTARSAGTSETQVDVQVSDRISSAADGAEIFLERVIDALLAGSPDLSIRV
ncbi:MAG TPA: hydantoinase/oxoprolinase family protein, partial [Planctomycetota bacterium]|nr:hydantoinase/oxoprolinase family protein [Planctomycetota bacterium]